MTIVLDTTLGWRDVAAVAAGAPLTLSPDALGRVVTGRAIVEAIIRKGVRAYGINTGVGALCEMIIPAEQQRALSRNIVLSHAVGLGPLLPPDAVRAIMAAAVNNFAHGHSGVRPAVVDLLVGLLDRGLTPDVPRQGSVGYLSHMAHVGLALIGEGAMSLDGASVPSRPALAEAGLVPLVLDPKEGLSVVNGSPCATGLGCLALARAERLLDWADAIAALSFESLDGQVTAFAPDSMGLHRSPGLGRVAARLRNLLAGSGRIAAAAGLRIQDALSLRAVPHVHGAARDTFDHAAAVVDRELASVTDNPMVLGTPAEPQVCSTANAVAAALALALDGLAVAMAELGAIAERRLDRLVNPLVSGLPAFLAPESGVSSGFMIAQYAAVSLVGENRRLAAPASLDGGITSALQEDHLSHATPAALKLLQILDNTARILGIELMAAVQASELHDGPEPRASATETLVRHVRAVAPAYRDDRVLSPDMERLASMVGQEACPVG